MAKPHFPSHYDYVPGVMAPDVFPRLGVLDKILSKP